MLAHLLAFSQWTPVEESPQCVGLTRVRLRIFCNGFRRGVASVRPAAGSKNMRVAHLARHACFTLLARSTLYLVITRAAPYILDGGFRVLADVRSNFHPRRWLARHVADKSGSAVVADARSNLHPRRWLSTRCDHSSRDYDWRGVGSEIVRCATGGPNQFYI